MTVVSPGVYAVERDFSLYAPALATSIFGIVTTASKGPVNELTFVTDEGTLVGLFGLPSVSHMGLYAAQRYLRRGRQLWVVRVATYDREADPLVVKDGTGAVDTLSFSPNSSGSWANTISITISAGMVAGTHKVVIRDGLYTAEVFDRLLVGAAHVGSPNYITTRINGVSDYVTVSVLDTAPTTLLVGTQTFSGGLDGAPADTSDVIGVSGSPPVVPATGLQLFRNPETLDINLIAVPGYSQKEVVAELIDICATRGDCMTLLEVPYGKSVQQAVEWHNGVGGGLDDPTGALNSSYAALYYPWAKVYDSNQDSEAWISPVGHAAAVIAYTDYVADPWWAPAGFNRGLLPDVLEIEHSPTQGERDYMYGGGNAINPIVNFSGQGFVIWGQRTLQRATTSLDRINVRRLLLYMRKVIATAVRYLVFEPNDEATWQRFVDLVEPVCLAIQGRRGLYGFKVICDSTTNTPEVIARNEMRGKILIQPTHAAEMIVTEFVLLPTGASFEEFSGI
jgi:hypothetical protein